MVLRETQLLLSATFSSLTDCFPAWKNQVDAQNQTSLQVARILVQTLMVTWQPPSPPPPPNQTVGRALSFLTASVEIYGALAPDQKQIQSFTVKSKQAEQ